MVKVELWGRGYVMDYCTSALRKSNEEKAFQNYIADGLYAIVTKKVTYNKRLSEVLHPITEEEKKERKEEQKKEKTRIISRIRNK